MKVPQLVAVLLLAAGLGFVALTGSGGGAASTAETVPIDPEPVALRDRVPLERPAFRGPHDGSHVYQGVRCPACERGPREF